MKDIQRCGESRRECEWNSVTVGEPIVVVTPVALVRTNNAGGQSKADGPWFAMIMNHEYRMRQVSWGRQLLASLTGAPTIWYIGRGGLVPGSDGGGSSGGAAVADGVARERESERKQNHHRVEGGFANSWGWRGFKE